MGATEPREQASRSIGFQGFIIVNSFEILPNYRNKISILMFNTAKWRSIVRALYRNLGKQEITAVQAG